MTDSNQWSDYIVYVDESGDHSLVSIDPDYPVFVLAFCIFHKRHYAESISTVLTQFKFRHFGHDMLVLHEHDIRKEENGFNFRNREAKNVFMAELGDIIEQHNFVIISVAIDKKRLADKKTNSSGLQLADLVARPIGLRVIRPEQKNRAFKILEKKLYSKNGRQGAGSSYEGYGLKCFP